MTCFTPVLLIYRAFIPGIRKYVVLLCSLSHCGALLLVRKLKKDDEFPTQGYTLQIIETYCKILKRWAKVSLFPIAVVNIEILAYLS